MRSPFEAKAVGTTSKGILNIPFIEQMLGCPIHHVGGLDGVVNSKLSTQVDAMVGWGRKATAVRARKLAQQLHRPFVALEDGLLRSYGTGDLYPPLSLVVDTKGIYYDSTCPSDLECLLESSQDLLAGIREDVLRAKELILENKLAKYNHAPLLREGLFKQHSSQKVLVIDQTFGDMSVSLGGADSSTFHAMLAAARSENPDATIYVKTHPEVASGRKRGYLQNIPSDDKTVILREPINPFSLIHEMDHVYVVTSTMGFEALMAGKMVTCFGLPWYSGWGVTDDRMTCARRSNRRTVDELFAAAYFWYSRYLNPYTHSKGTIFDVIDWLVRQRRVRDRYSVADGGRMVGLGFRRWKAFNLAPMLSLEPRLLSFLSESKIDRFSLNAKDVLFFWGAHPPKFADRLCQLPHAGTLRVEDGFIRSVGLGSDLIRPSSLVLDRSGIYFDPRFPSDLENLLSTKQWSAEDLRKAEIVRQRIVDAGMTKYNLEPQTVPAWAGKAARIVLVPGQVDDDASIRFGCTHVRSNLELLRTVRAACPEAFIVYKPHPDVLSGNRTGRIDVEQAAHYADWIETQCSVVSCINACDEVHTMTSLSGFDALLRRKLVFTYGQPFYAGWGLTNDLGLSETVRKRRNRVLTIDELVAGALVCYPIYWDWALKGYTTCEAVVNNLANKRDELVAKNQLHKLRIGYLRRQVRKIRVLVQAWKK